MSRQMIILLLIYLNLFIQLTNSEIILTSCARMNTPVLKKVAQGSCITSCKYQNCGTGSCQYRKNRPVCVCSRCTKGGGEWPHIPSKRKG